MWHEFSDPAIIVPRERSAERRDLLPAATRESPGMDFRKSRQRTPISDQCGRCNKWHFIHELRAIELTEDGQTFPTLICGNCLKAIRRRQGETAAARFDLPLPAARGLALIFRRTIGASDRHAPEFRAHTIGLDYVLQLWVEQEGLCALSGRPMRWSAIGSGALDIPSIDRIDSRRGYEHGNVQWTCWAVNMMKQDMTDADLIRWCRRVAIHQQTKAKAVKAEAAT